MYPPQVVEHFEHPRNVGELSAPTVVVRRENPACGDVMELQLRIEAGCVAEAAFRVRGCVAAIAAGSALTEAILGMQLAELHSFTREKLVAALGGLTPHSMHASHLAMDALRASLSELEGASG